jgi:DNA-binding CsgD family transcriptional regulator
MTTKEALRKLMLARKRQTKARNEIKVLISFLNKTGTDWNGERAKSKRNLKIYQLWTKGIKPKQLAKRFDLSYDRILSLCHREEVLEIRRAEIINKKPLKMYIQLSCQLSKLSRKIS